MFKPFKTIYPYLVEDRWTILVGFFSLIVVDILQLTVPRIIKTVIDYLTEGPASPDQLLKYAASIVVMALFIVILRFLWRLCFIGTSRRIEKSLRARLFKHIIRLPLTELLESKTGDLMARMTNDLEAVRMCAGIGLVALFDTLFLGLASISFMIYISPLLTALCLIPMLIIIIATWRLSGMLHHRFSRVQASFSSLTERVRESIAGISVIKAYAAEPFFFDSFQQSSLIYIQRNLSLIKVMGLFFPVIMFFSNLSVGLLIFFGGRFTITGGITPGDFVAFASYLWIVTWPMMALGWVTNLYQRGSASLIRINDILNKKPEPLQLSDPSSDLPSSVSRLDVRRLTFAYSYGSAPVLKDISFSLMPGETLGITGKTGSGKTTLCNLLVRLFNPPPQCIFLDGIDVREIPLPQLRAYFAYVPQDNFLFSDTIRSNLSFGRPEISAEGIRMHAGQAQFLKEINEFKNGFDTIIGERGVTLSGGQKQRLCIARALAMNSTFLILDDSLSSLDVETTEYLIAALKMPRQTAASIIISNRIASIQHADRILVLDGGEIVDSGTHRELVQREGLYRRLYLKQQLENNGA